MLIQPCHIPVLFKIDIVLKQFMAFIWTASFYAICADTRTAYKSVRKINILKSVYLGNTLLFSQVLLKTMEHCLLFFQVSLLFFLCRDLGG